MKTIEQKFSTKQFTERIVCHGHAASSCVGRIVAVLTLALLATTLAPGQGLAASPLSNECQVLLGFKQSYTAQSGSSRTHCGIDCAASAGDTLYAPAGGKISFVGSVPAGEDAGSGTTIAISIDIGGGLTATMMPVEDAYVNYGDYVSEGQAVGILAASGDKSMSQTHLHVGLKKKTNNRNVYLDPSWLIGVGGSNVANEQEASVESAVFSGQEIEIDALGEPALSEAGEQIVLGDLGVEEYVSSSVPSGDLAANTDLLGDAEQNATITSGAYGHEGLDFIDEQSLQSKSGGGPLEWLGDKFVSIGAWITQTAGKATSRLVDLFMSISQDVSTIPAVVAVGVALIAVFAGIIKVTISLISLGSGRFEKMAALLKQRSQSHFGVQLRQTLAKTFGNSMR